jgi:hypothetical protein
MSESPPTTSKVADVPQADFLNGMDYIGHHENAVPVADSTLGLVFKLNVDTGSTGVAIDESLTKIAPSRRPGRGKQSQSPQRLRLLHKCILRVSPDSPSTPISLHPVPRRSLPTPTSRGITSTIILPSRRAAQCMWRGAGELELGYEDQFR